MGKDTEQIRAHIERHIGRIDRVLHGIASDAARVDVNHDAARVDVNHVAPCDSRPYHTLITSGLSDFSMPVPPHIDAPQRLELMITLPEYWKLDDEARTQPQWSWPVDLLQTLARFPREHQTWLGWGHTVPNGDPPQAFAPSTRLCGAIIAPSLLVPVAFYQLEVAGGSVAFYSAIPLYKEEMDLKLKHGMEAVLTRLLRHDINDVVDPKRRNVARRFLGWL